MEKLTRRQFLQSAAAVALMSQLPMPKGGTDFPPEGFWIKDKVVGFNPTPDKPTFTPLQLHRFLADANDKMEGAFSDELCIIDETPSIRHTDYLIEMTNGWSCDSSVFASGRNGGIKQGDDYWVARTEGI